MKLQHIFRRITFLLIVTFGPWSIGRYLIIQKETNIPLAFAMWIVGLLAIVVGLFAIYLLWEIIAWILTGRSAKTTGLWGKIFN